MKYISVSDFLKANAVYVNHAKKIAESITDETDRKVMTAFFDGVKACEDNLKSFAEKGAVDNGKR